MRIKKGDIIEDIELPGYDGSRFKLSNTKGKKVLLTFYRFASCGVCNLRINEFVKRYEEFGKNFTMVGIFHAPVDFLKKNMDRHNLPFTVLADENFEYFNKYDVERSYGKLFSAIIFKVHRFFLAGIKGYLPVQFKGHVDIVPVDVLINEEGIVEDVYYGESDIADHMPFEKVKLFSQA
jgi:peroxiredoxin